MEDSIVSFSFNGLSVNVDLILCNNEYYWLDDFINFLNVLENIICNLVVGIYIVEVESIGDVSIGYNL